MIRKDLTYNSYTLEILGASDSGVGLNPTNAYSFIRKSQNGTLITNNPDRINTVTYTGLLPNERYENLYKVKDKKGNVADGNSLIFYTLGIPAKNAEVVSVEGTSANFKLHLEPNPNGTRYALKLVNPHVSQVLSSPQTIDKIDNIKMTGILPELEYELFVAPVNDENVEGVFKQMYYPTGHPKEGQKVTVKGELIIQLVSSQSDIGTISDKVGKVYTTKILSPMTTPTDLYLVGNGKEILIKKGILNDYAAIDLKAKIIKGSSQPTITNDSSTLEVTIPVDLTDGLYENFKFVARSSSANKDFSTDGFKFRVDTTAPITSNYVLEYISKDNALLKMSLDDTSDNFSNNSRILVQINSKDYRLADSITVARTADNKVKFTLLDEIGNEREYEVDWNYFPDPPSGTGGTTEDISQKGKDDMTAEIIIPEAGTHYQISLDGASWSPWIEKPDSKETVVTLPSGDGIKSGYIRTGEQKTEYVPLYVGESNPKMVPLNDVQIEPVMIPEKIDIVTDLTPPKLDIKTEDGVNVAIGGKLKIIATVYDNMDMDPGLVIAIFGRTETGEITDEPVIDPIETTISGANQINGTQVKITIPGLDALKPEDGKNYPFVLKVIATDQSGNYTIKTLPFYIK